MSKAPLKEQRGSALPVTMLVIFLITIAVAISMQLTTGTLRHTDASRDFSALRSAAEGALEFAYGVWTQKTNNLFAPVSSSDLTNALATVPTFSGFSYAPSGENGPLAITPVEHTEATSSGPFRLISTTFRLDRQKLDILQRAPDGNLHGRGQVKYGVKRTINLGRAAVPVEPRFRRRLGTLQDGADDNRRAVHTTSRGYVIRLRPEGLPSPVISLTREIL